MQTAPLPCKVCAFQLNPMWKTSHGLSFQESLTCHTRFFRVKYVSFFCQLRFLIEWCNEAGHEIFIANSPIYIRKSQDSRRRKQLRHRRSEVALNITAVCSVLWNGCVWMACANCFFSQSAIAIHWAPIMDKVFLRECETLKYVKGKQWEWEEIAGVLCWQQGGTERKIRDIFCGKTLRRLVIAG